MTIQKIRNAVITINNWEPSDLIRLKSLTYSYIVLSAETGSKGTPHIQGYIEFKNPVGFNALHKKLNKRAHIERRKGSPTEAAGYCKKGNAENEDYNLYFNKPHDSADILFEDGEISKQGKRNDITELTDMIQDGYKMRDVALKAPSTFVKYHKGLKAFQSTIIEPRNTKPEVTVLWGETGCGKSKRARELLDNYYVWTPQRGMWFDGYEGQTEVIFEEFRGQIPLGMLLSILDRYECPVQYKGGTIEFVGTKIVITSPLPPEKWYCSDNFDEYDKYSQLKRRIDKIINLDKFE